MSLLTRSIFTSSRKPPTCCDHRCAISVDNFGPPVDNFRVIRVIHNCPDLSTAVSHVITHDRSTHRPPFSCDYPQDSQRLLLLLTLFLDQLEERGPVWKFEHPPPGSVDFANYKNFKRVALKRCDRLS